MKKEIITTPMCFYGTKTVENDSRCEKCKNYPMEQVEILDLIKSRGKDFVEELLKNRIAAIDGTYYLIN